MPQSSQLVSSQLVVVALVSPPAAAVPIRSLASGRLGGKRSSAKLPINRCCLGVGGRPIQRLGSVQSHQHPWLLQKGKRKQGEKKENQGRRDQERRTSETGERRHARLNPGVAVAKQDNETALTFLRLVGGLWETHISGRARVVQL